jgi:hypothetical protein
MNSSYRLGDVIVQGYNNHELNKEIFTEHPDSIGCDYVLSLDKTDRIGCATQIILKHMEKYVHLYPSDIETSTVVHLRLGDAVGGHHFYEKRLRPFDVSYYQSILPQGKVYVIGKCHFGRGECSTNYDECKELSNAYMMNILNALGATHFDGGNADIDLCCAIKAKNFIQGRGYYSKLIVEVRRRLGLKSIETSSHNFNA